MDEDKVSNSANILITTVQVPFTRGGAEILVDGLKRELVRRNHRVEVVQLPFSSHKEDLLTELAAWRSLKLESCGGADVDLLIATKFPSYIAQHPRKVVWLVHQHRQIYELYGSRFCDFKQNEEDESLRRLIVKADEQALKEAMRVFTISGNVRDRLSRYNDVPAQVLTPPLPLGNRYFHNDPQPFILSVGRICSIKRVDLLIKSMPLINSQLKLKVVGLPDEPGIDEYLRNEISKHHLGNRIAFLGRVEEEELLHLYATAFAVYYAPFDEDYGFVTLEALASGKPVVTATDSGGVLEFIAHRTNGIITDPTEAGISGAFNAIFSDPALYEQLTKNACVPGGINTWDEVVSNLTASLPK